MKTKMLGLSLLLAAAQVVAQPPPAVVELANVVERETSETLRLPGTVISRRDAQISAEIDGRLSWVAEVGEEVAQGEPLAVIDDHVLQLELRNREAQVARIAADIAYNQRQQSRLKRLAQNNSLAESELDEVESRLLMLQQDLRIAEVSRDRARYDVQRTTVAAPFTGIVVAREMEPGEYTHAGNQLVRLVDTQELEVSVNAPLRVARYSSVGELVQVENKDEYQLTAIRGIVPVGDTSSRMMELRLQLAEGHWLIGEAVTVELPASPAVQSLAVPRDALVLRDKQVFVYTLSEENTAVKVPVTTGAGRGGHIAVQGELTAGDPVIVRGAERLQHGQTVKVLQHHLAAG